MLTSVVIKKTANDKIQPDRLIYSFIYSFNHCEAYRESNLGNTDNKPRLNKLCQLK